MTDQNAEVLLNLIAGLRALIAKRESLYEVLATLAREIGDQPTDALVVYLATWPRSDSPNTGMIAIAIIEAELARRTPITKH